MKLLILLIGTCVSLNSFALSLNHKMILPAQKDQEVPQETIKPIIVKPSYDASMDEDEEIFRENLSTDELDEYDTQEDDY